MAKREKVAENKFVKAIEKKYNAICYKQQTFARYGTVGHSDRVALLPLKVVLFFEFKRDKKKKATKIQRARHRHILKLGHKVNVVYRSEEALAICAKALRKAAQKKEARRVRTERTSRRKH